jgi:hypothetical protein
VEKLMYQGPQTAAQSVLALRGSAAVAAVRLAFCFVQAFLSGVWA